MKFKNRAQNEETLINSLEACYTMKAITKHEQSDSYSNFCCFVFVFFTLILSWRGPLSYRNHCSANQWTGCYMITASVMKELTLHFESLVLLKTRTTAVDPRHWKVKDTEKDQPYNQKLLHHYQHAKKSTINQFLLEILQILESYDLKSHPIFNQVHQIITNVTFRFPGFVWTCKKSAQLINSFLRYSIFHSSVTRNTTLIFDHAHPLNIKVTFRFCEFFSEC